MSDYDPRYPFGKPTSSTKKAEEKKEEKTQSATAENDQTQPKQPKQPSKDTTQSHTLRNTLITLGILGALAGAAYGAYSYLQDEPQKESITQTNEPVLHCPVFNPTAIKASYDERRSHAYVNGNLDAHPTFSDELNEVVAREILIGLSSGLEKYQAIGMADQNLQDGIKYDKQHPPRGIGYGLTQLRSNFPTPMAVQTRDVDRVLGAASFRMQTAVSNLDGYSADEAQKVLEMFGGLMVHPDLGREVVREASQNQDWAAEVQKRVIRETSQGIHNGMMPHDAVCYAVSSVFDNTRTPMAFYTYAQTMNILSGKTKTQMLNALGENLEQLKTQPYAWVSSHSAWLSTMSPARTNVRLDVTNTNAGR